MQPIKVTTNENYIVIEQKLGVEDQEIIFIHPTQVPALVGSLQEAKRNWKRR